MRLGMPLAEYERAIGPANKHFHEIAEMVVLHKEGVLPVHDEDGDGMAADADAGVGESMPVDDHGKPTFENVSTHGSPAKK